MNKYDLGWGESVTVRSCFLSHTSGGPVVLGLQELHDLGYPKHEGHPELIEITKKVVERQTGTTYNHVLLTNGATGGVTIALRAYQQRGHNVAFTRSAPYFGIYPAMIEAAGLRHMTEGQNREPTDNPVALIDSPTNPQGMVIDTVNHLGMPTIWDAVYHNNVYTPGNLRPLPCDVVVGSYSKLLGINGLRVGWIATNDGLLYERLRSLVTAEYCGISGADSLALLHLLKPFNDPEYWEMFEVNARYWLDLNREEWAKLERYFQGSPVPEIGMFYYSYMDGFCKKLMSESNIIWMPGSALGTDDFHARFNLGQDSKLIKNAVREVLKNDKVKK